MANSRFEYVKSYEQDDRLLPGCWIVVRIDGKGFTKFTEEHNFEKPNDARGLNLMNDAAKEVMRQYHDIRISYGESDEFSFVLHKDTSLYGRRASKILSVVVSCFAAAFVRFWHTWLPDQPLQRTPVFDGRCVCYPSPALLRDYLCWRQVDTHVNNQYNTVFWALVHAGQSPAEAQGTLKGTRAAYKNELLFERFGVNYNDLPEMFRRGSVLLWQQRLVVAKHDAKGQPVMRMQRELIVVHEDMVKEGFWQQHPELLAD